MCIRFKLFSHSTRHDKTNFLWEYGLVRYLVFWLKYLSSLAADRSSRSKKLKHDVIEAINELIQDIDTCHELISEQAVEHIHQKY